MLRNTKIALALITIFGVASHAPLHAAAFTPGNLVVYRVSDGTALLTNTGNAVFLDEYSVALDGTALLVQSIPMPTAAAAPTAQMRMVICSASASPAAQLLQKDC